MCFTTSELKSHILPTKCDVINLFLYLRHNSDRNRKLGAFKQEALRRISLSWQRVRIPIVAITTLRKRLDKLIIDYYKVVKYPKQYIDNEWNKIFLISRCMCGIERNISCNCSASDRIPDDAIDFFIDQCGPRLLTFDDIVEKMSASSDGVQTNKNQSSSNVVYTEFDTCEYQPNSDEEMEFEDNIGELFQTTKPKFTVADIPLRNFSSALDRSNTSVRYGALLATMLIKDLKLAILAKAEDHLSAETAETMLQFFDGLIIDKNKIFRERVKFRKEAIVASRCHELLTCISFDGKKEKTLKTVKEANVTRNIIVNEEHITIVKEPNSKFIGYATPRDSTALGIQKSIADYLKREHYNMDDLVAISCDGTPTNTGYKNGVIARMEHHLQRPLQWFVCLFHFNELPLNALLRSLLGKQKGPGLWPGSIGEGIQNCIKYSVNKNFERIPMGDLPANIEGWNVRGDQLYLYSMVRAVHTGECDEKLASEKPGAVSTARWITTASRILRFYVTCSQPSKILKQLVNFIVKVYAPFWFLIKSQSLAIHGSRNVFQYISWIRQLPEDVQEIIHPVIKNNAYFFHPENILLSMITDQNPFIRSDGYDKILLARNETTGGIRQMFGPQVNNFINFQSDSYTDMINWNKFELTEPPCLQFYAQEQLQALQHSNEIIELPAYLCHCQNTERFVHVVHESAMAVTDQQRIGHIFSKLNSRQKYSQIESRRNMID